MKNGQVVRIKKTGRVGMITWRKNNDQIGVNYSHYHSMMLLNGKCSLEDLKGLGADDQFSKDELEELDQ